MKTYQKRKAVRYIRTLFKKIPAIFTMAEIKALLDLEIAPKPKLIRHRTKKDAYTPILGE